MSANIDENIKMISDAPYLLIENKISRLNQLIDYNLQLKQFFVGERVRLQREIKDIENTQIRLSDEINYYSEGIKHLREKQNQLNSLCN